MSSYLKNLLYRVRATIFIVALVLTVNAGFTFGQEGDAITSLTSEESGDESVDANQTTDLTVILTVYWDGSPTKLCALKNADITVLSNKKNIGPLTMDELGEAVFKSLPRSTISITVNSDDLESPTQHSVDLIKENQIEYIPVKWPIGKLKISVFEKNNNTPVPYCNVRVESTCGDTYLERRTDENGALEVSLPFGELKIMLIKKGWKTKIESFTLHKEVNEKRIELTEQSPPQS